MPKKQSRKPWSILIALALAIFVGSVINQSTTLIGIPLYKVFDIIGTLFINALTLVVVPLVASSIIMGVARIASESQFGRLGAKTFALFLATNLLGIVIGLLAVDLFKPGVGVPVHAAAAAQADTFVRSGGGMFSKLVLEIIPPNVLAAFAKGNMLGLIFFSLLFGYAITQIKKVHLQTHLQVWKGVFEAMLKIVHGIMYFLPVGVFCLAAKIFADAGIETLKPLGNFIWTALLAMSIFSFGIIPLLLKMVGKVSVRNYYKAVAPALVTAFSTGSSSATLPIALECMEERAGLSNRICSLVIPLGTSINLSGTALYTSMGGLFIAQVFGIDLSIGEQILYVLTTLLISFGVASVPGGGLVSSLTLLRIMGLPIEGLGLLIALDRILDMFRTSTNLFSYTTNATLIAASEGEKRILVKKTFN